MMDLAYCFAPPCQFLVAALYPRRVEAKSCPTGSASLAAIGKILCLWAILFATFALAYVQAFGNTKLGNNATSRYSNHRSWGNSLLSLATASTGEAWNANMHDYMVEYPRCVDNDSYLISDCGHETWALGLFSSWNLISM